MTTHSQAPDQGKQPDPCTCGHRVADHVADDWDDRGNPVNPICRVADCDCDWSGLRSPTVNVDVDTSAVRAKLLRTTDSGRSGLDPSVTTTFIVELSPHQLDLSGYAGDFADDYDMDAVRADYISLINCELPDGITLFANGQVYATLEQADNARDIDWSDVCNRLNVEPIFERHEVKR